MLGQILLSRLKFLEVNHSVFPQSRFTQSQVVPSSRIIAFIRGRVCYEVENSDPIIAVPGTVLFVPQWTWRKWKVIGGKPAELTWAVFNVGEGLLSSVNAVVSQPECFDLLKAALLRMYDLWQASEEEQLILEGEMKAILARFFLSAPTDALTSITSSRHPEVNYAVGWLQDHYAVPSALFELQEQLTLNPDYFRNLFRRQMHFSPNQYLTMLRMRAARYFLSKREMSIKEVAESTGYPDALYFSRTYRKFWKRAPSEDRG
ncbi:helix-turn-helix transcriptional regulator [Coraliomargarita parva]|uniref:helix-turn-helix transcriptional regulator n=1 Tax=Coraliomargarita parva TaxID=3014050 RepID=UPI0022B35BB7|nr:AraC family transcriptional regulator [Coraliomargarita parva]